MTIQVPTDPLRADVHGNSRGETFRLFDAVSEVDGTNWINIAGARAATLQVTSTTGTFAIEVRGIMLDGEPSASEDGQKIIASDISAAGFYPIEKFTTWLKIKQTTSSAGTRSVWVHVAY